MLQSRKSLRINFSALLIFAGAILPGAAMSVASAATTVPNPCRFLSVAQINGALGEKTQPSVKLTSGAAVVCTYKWGSSSLIVRLISAGIESESGGIHEPGMGAHGLLISASTYTQVAFIKAGWSVWLVAMPRVNTHGLVVLGQTIYPKVHAEPE